MHKSQLKAVVSFAILHHIHLSDAFPMFSEHPARASIISLQSSRSSMTALLMHTEDEHGDFFDVEAARRQLESLVTDGTGRGGSSRPEQPQSRKTEEAPRPMRFASIAPLKPESTPFLSDAPALDVRLPTRPPLTTIERERRLAEIELLSQLDDGDETLSDIWDLWFTERGPQAADLLHQADDMMDEGQENWQEAELILRALIEDFGVYFTEPVKCLAKLYFLQGRLEEALTLNKMVLAMKPWHFGALSHIVMVYAAMGDNAKARQWATFRLPTFASIGSNRRRTRWVESAVVDATVLLHQGERELSQAFGQSDKKWIEDRKKSNDDETDADVWQ